MRKMQCNFAEAEAQMREKNSCLEVEMANKDLKLASLQDCIDRHDKAKFELMTKNAELQEKIVNLQTLNCQIKERRGQESLANFEFEEKMKEKILSLERSLEMAEKCRNDRKEEFIQDLKQLVNDEKLAEKILDLENALTELEEEKGNLQLKLVDFEDLNASEKMAKSEVRF